MQKVISTLKRPLRTKLKKKNQSTSTKKILIKVYSKESEAISKLFEKLKALKDSNVSFFRIKQKTKKIAYRKGPSGKGYAVWKKYKSSLKRGIVMVKQMNIYNTVTKLLQINGLYNRIVFR